MARRTHAGWLAYCELLLGGANTMLVSNWMSRNVVTIAPETTLPDALQLMKEHRVRRLPVMVSDSLVGIVTDRDLRECIPSKATDLEAHELRYLLEKTPVSTVMTTQLLTVEPEMPIEQAASIMRRHKIGGLPVLQTTRLVGVITESDIFEAMIELFGQQEFGARVTLDLGSSATAMQSVLGILQEFAPHVISAITYTREDFPATRLMVLKLRVGRMGLDSLLRTLSSTGHIVTDARFGDEGEQLAAFPVTNASSESHQTLGKNFVLPP